MKEVMMEVLPYIFCIIDGGNGSNGVDSVGSYVPTLMAKSIESIKETTGIDIRDIMMAESYDAKVNKNITVNKESDLNVGIPLSE